MRKTITYTIKSNDRDAGKVFQIEEMSAAASEDWALRAFFAMMNAGGEFPQDIIDQGMAGVASMGISALTKIPYEAAKPLLDDMLKCVKFIPDPGRPEVVRTLDPSDIEETATFLKLRAEVFNLHTGFLSAVAPSISALTTAMKSEG